MKRRPMQDWAHSSIQRELEETEKNLGPYLDSRDWEIVYRRVGGCWMIWIQRKQRASIDDISPAFAEQVEENFQLWTSGPIFSLVDFAIALEKLRDFIHQLSKKLQSAKGSGPLQPFLFASSPKGRGGGGSRRRREGGTAPPTGVRVRPKRGP